MRKSKMLAKIRAGQPARIAQMSHYLPMFVAYAAYAGYDGIWLDLEHHAMDDREVQALLAFFQRYDIDCMLRPSTREKGQLYRYLEDGATGLMIPHVGNAETARDLVRKVKFPPVGDRGVEGFGMETNFSLDIKDSMRELVEHANRETFLVVQIETPEGLANVDSIAAVPGVDGLFMGPFDLSVRMAYQPENQQVSMDEAMQRVAAAAHAHQKAWGSFALTLDVLRPQLALGATLLSLGADFLLLKDAVLRCGQDLDDLLNGQSTGE